MKLTPEQKIELLGELQRELNQRYERLLQNSQVLPFTNTPVVRLRDVPDIMMKDLGTSILDFGVKY